MSWMKRVCVCVASLMIVGSVVVWAQPEPSTQPTAGHDQQDSRTARGASGRWGFAPYNKLSGMTEEQKQKISDIHRKANAERKAIDDKEEADVMAVLTDAQKAELEKMEADRKAKSAEKRSEKKEKKDEKKEEKDK